MVGSCCYRDTVILQEEKENLTQKKLAKLNSCYNIYSNIKIKLFQMLRKYFSNPSVHYQLAFQRAPWLRFPLFWTPTAWKSSRPSCPDTTWRRSRPGGLGWRSKAYQALLPTTNLPTDWPVVQDVIARSIGGLSFKMSLLMVQNSIWPLKSSSNIQGGIGHLRRHLLFGVCLANPDSIGRRRYNLTVQDKIGHSQHQLLVKHTAK